MLLNIIFISSVFFLLVSVITICFIRLFMYFNETIYYSKLIKIESENQFENRKDRRK